MVQIVATPEQARLLANTTDSVEIVDLYGNRLGIIARLFSANEIAEAQRRAQSDEPRKTTAETIERLKSSESESSETRSFGSRVP